LIGAFEDTLRLPIIPPFGELTLYYDMYALVDGPRETLGSAFLGDPTDLVNSGSFSLIQTGDPSTPVPEPATLFLVGIGLIAMGAMVRRKSGV
jgi:hypothetical protein